MQIISTVYKWYIVSSPGTLQIGWCSHPGEAKALGTINHPCQGVNHRYLWYLLNQSDHGYKKPIPSKQLSRQDESAAHCWSCESHYAAWKSTNVLDDFTSTRHSNLPLKSHRWRQLMKSSLHQSLGTTLVPLAAGWSADGAVDGTHLGSSWRVPARWCDPRSVRRPPTSPVAAVATCGGAPRGPDFQHWDGPVRR